jgi:non-specific serine/threonine protein kinase/serine/threonine-protein kinase
MRAKAIIHRDLKPSTFWWPRCGKPMPKIIDFGVAKASPTSLPPIRCSALELSVGTPELHELRSRQAFHEDVDTRLHVYSLGVVLYELLAGTIPFDYRKLAFDEVLRVVREEDAAAQS